MDKNLKMKILVIAIPALLGACGGTLPPVDLCVKNVTVISADLPAPLLADVCIDQGEITSIETGGKARAATETIDGSDRFLIPGLIDSHVHLYHAPGLNRRYTKQYDDLIAAYREQLPRSFLYYGYTSVIELNAYPAANQRFEAAPEHPDLYHCGQGLVLSNDFMATDYEVVDEFFAEYPNFLHDRFTTPELPPGFDPEDHTPAATVAKIAEQGGRCVKLYYEEALWWPGPERPSFELPSEQIAREVVFEAHNLGLPVLLHATTPAGYRFALATGVDTVAHGLWEWPGGFRNGGIIPPEIAELGDELAASGVRVQPTAQTLHGTATLFEDALLDDPRLLDALPGAYVTYLRTDAQMQQGIFLDLFGPQIAETSDGEEELATEVANALAYVNHRFENEIGLWQQNGARLLLGTDTAVGGFGWSHPPGLAGFWEMQAWARGGVPLAAIFRAATLDNAEAFGLENDIGSVAVGRRANLLLLGKNPLDDLSAYDAIDKVILNGRILDREALSARR